MGSGSNPGDNPTNPVVPNLDDMAEMEKMVRRKIQSNGKVDYHCGIDAKDLSLAPDLVLPPKFKTSEFEKYKGTSYPKAHITLQSDRVNSQIVQPTEPYQNQFMERLSTSFYEAI
ncbi:receptor-like protein 12 [Gossypium australe]|uniref:Receptor-like protein 12 n=1 Tax=Gossypium australe TaxID=47621 RepID=A0A5B6WTW5_9ROSI|nr:receptor-like protein 12 [Gossypium australe]